MRNFILIHGTGSGPDMWLPWLKEKLEVTGAKVWMPTLPGSEKAILGDQLPYVLSGASIDSDTVMVGHSAGCPLILSVLEEIDTTIDTAVLVAGYYKPHKSGSNPDPILQSSYDWDKIKKSARNFIWLVSDDDPWGCGEDMARPVFEKLGGTMIIVHEGGHFGSNTFQNPLYEFPLLLNLVGEQ